MKTGALKFLLIFIYETEHWNGLNNCLENNSVQKLVCTLKGRIYQHEKIEHYQLSPEMSTKIDCY